MFSELEQLFQRLTPEILLAVLIGAGIIAFLLVLLLNRYRSRLRLRIFLYKPLPCTVDRMRFLRSKSLFDILIDMGLSKKALDYLYKELGWIPSEGVLGHIDLNTKVSDSVAQYGNYESFITHSKAQLQGFPKNSLPEVQSRAVSLDRRPILDEPSPDKSLAIEKIMEERRVFNSMFICLRDETKVELAKRLGITHRFDYLTTEVFRTVGESDKRHLVSSLDFETHSNADLLLVLGTLSAAAGVPLWIGGQVLDSAVALSTISDVSVASGAEGAGDISEGLGDLGEIALILAAFFFTASVIKKISKAWRERKLKRYKEEFKVCIEELSDKFFGQGEEQALRVPRLVIHALEIEKARLDVLNDQLTRNPLDSDPKSNIARLSLTSAMEAAKLNNRMLDKFSKEINNLLKNVKRYAKNGRRDLAGLHLYVNKELVFLPSQLPEKQLKEISGCQIRLMQEVARLSDKT